MVNSKEKLELLNRIFVAARTWDGTKKTYSERDCFFQGILYAISSIISFQQESGEVE